MFKLVSRNLQPNEAQTVVDEVKTTPNITGYSLKEWLSYKKILVAEDEEGKMLGVCLYYDFHKNWSFISVLIVLKPFRGMGIGKSLFEKCCDNILRDGKNIYTASKNPIVINMMKKMNFTLFDTLFGLPKGYKKYEFIFILRLINWIFSSYRLKQAVRKAKLYGVRSNFTYGIKSYEQYQNVRI